MATSDRDWDSALLEAPAWAGWLGAGWHSRPAIAHLESAWPRAWLQAAVFIRPPGVALLPSLGELWLAGLPG